MKQVDRWMFHCLTAGKQEMSEMCTICGAEFAGAADLLEHKKLSHKDADPASDVEMNPEAHTRGYLCGLCGQRFPTAQALAQHNLQPHPMEREARRPQPA
jgi:DNA-directed RNA polymerase subunit RPC12/RpoP